MCICIIVISTKVWVWGLRRPPRSRCAPGNRSGALLRRRAITKEVRFR